MRDRKDETEEAERSTAAILHRADEAADRIEKMLQESEDLLERLRSGA